MMLSGRFPKWRRIENTSKICSNFSEIQIYLTLKFSCIFIASRAWNHKSIYFICLFTSRFLLCLEGTKKRCEKNNSREKFFLGKSEIQIHNKKSEKFSPFQLPSTDNDTESYIFIPQPPPTQPAASTLLSL